MNSLRRMLDVLELFSPDQPVIDVDAIVNQLGYTPASAYRYLRELGDVGLLVRLPRGYALGPRVIQLERQMSDHNPVLVHSRDLVDRLVSETGLDVLVSELYGQRVINIALKRGSDIAPLGPGRGWPLDLFRSATARVVLAYLQPRQIRRLYDAHVGEPGMAQVAPDWKGFQKALLAIRRQGYCISRGALNPGRSGVAAPVFDEKRRVLGSITLVGRTERFDAFQEPWLCSLITGAARELTQRIAGG